MLISDLSQHDFGLIGLSDRVVVRDDSPDHLLRAFAQLEGLAVVVDGVLLMVGGRRGFADGFFRLAQEVVEVALGASDGRPGRPLLLRDAQQLARFFERRLQSGGIAADGFVFRGLTHQRRRLEVVSVRAVRPFDPADLGQRFLKRGVVVGDQRELPQGKLRTEILGVAGGEGFPKRPGLGGFSAGGVFAGERLGELILSRLIERGGCLFDGFEDLESAIGSSTCVAAARACSRSLEGPACCSASSRI